jgi:hypothetical protein
VTLALRDHPTPFFVFGLGDLAACKALAEDFDQKERPGSRFSLDRVIRAAMHMLG